MSTQVPWKNMLIGALILGFFVSLGTAVVSLTWLGTAERIAENQRLALLRGLNQLIDPDSYNNPLEEDVIQISHPLLGSDQPMPVYRARRDGQPIALVLSAVAPDGYAGDIRLLIGIRHDGRLTGVRVLEHRETPGLGDAIDERRSDWILGFSGRSLDNPPESRWHVKKDGGDFDQFTGATITPRAVVRAVHRALHYYHQHREALFAPLAVNVENPNG
jgi:Na+-translocating ferredoxin:NAD+ oxidoreductase subunit G